MSSDRQVLYWINQEIPRYLAKFATFEEFDNAMPEACASGAWKTYAYAMAKERWGISEITRIPA